MLRPRVGALAACGGLRGGAEGPPSRRLPLRVRPERWRSVLSWWPGASHAQEASIARYCGSAKRASYAARVTMVSLVLA